MKSTMRTSRITRRRLLAGGLCGSQRLTGASGVVDVPVLRLVNRHSVCTPAELQRFVAGVWDQASRAFQSCGVFLRLEERPGEILQYPSGRPRFVGLERNRLNVVLTDSIPLHWAMGRSLAGVTTIYEGYHLSLIALRNAYANRLPMLAVNTVVHELLHAFRGDIFIRRSGLLDGADRELAVDWQATRLWLSGYAPGVQECARAYVQRLMAAHSAG